MTKGLKCEQGCESVLTNGIFHSSVDVLFVLDRAPGKKLKDASAIGFEWVVITSRGAASDESASDDVVRI